MSESEENESQMVSLDEAYAVEQIRSHKVLSGQDFYLVKWLGYPEAQNTWEPADNLKTVKNMIEDFKEKFKNAKRDRQANPAKKNTSESKPKAQDDVGRTQPQPKAPPKQKTPTEPSREAREKKTAQSAPKQSRTSATSDSANGPTEKKKAPILQDKSANDHFKNVIKEKDPNPKKRSSSSNHEKKLENKIRKPDESKETRIQSSKSEEDRAQPTEGEDSKPTAAKKAKTSVTSVDYSTQQPERTIKKINHIVLKGDEIYYEVEFVKSANQKQPVNLLPSGMLMRENPTIIAEYFQRKLLQDESGS